MPFGREALLRPSEDFVERRERRFVEGVSGFFQAYRNWPKVLVAQALVVLRQTALHELEGPAAVVFDAPFFRLESGEVVDNGLRVVPMAQWLLGVPCGMG
jgi:hypothetical protein